MAAGEVSVPDVDESKLKPGAVVTASGRVSAAVEYSEPEQPGPFSEAQLARLDEALTFASRDTGIDFSIYVGDLGQDTRGTAEELMRRLGAKSANSVVIAVSPGQRVVELVTGATAKHRLSERSAKLAVMTMVASFREGDIVGGLVGGLRMLDDQAGPAPK